MNKETIKQLKKLGLTNAQIASIITTIDQKPAPDAVAPVEASNRASDDFKSNLMQLANQATKLATKGLKKAQSKVQNKLTTDDDSIKRYTTKEFTGQNQQITAICFTGSQKQLNTYSIYSIPVPGNGKAYYIVVEGANKPQPISIGDYIVNTDGHESIVDKQTFKAKYLPITQNNESFGEILTSPYWIDKHDYVSHPKTILSELVNNLGQLNGQYNQTAQIDSQTLAQTFANLIRLAYDQDLLKDPDQLLAQIKQELLQH